MKRLTFAIAALALGVSASTAARADYAVVMFKDGTCRAWDDGSLKPLQPGWKYHWVNLKSRDEANSKMHYSMKRHWCKSWVKW